MPSPVRLAQLCAWPRPPALAAQAEFLADSSAHLDLRNFYQLRDYRQHDAPQSQAGNWSQGFVLRLQSGFTGGPLGFGLDATGLLGVKLDSGRGRSNDGTLPFGANSKEPVDDYSHLGLTAKLRYSQTQLQVGILMPQLPVAFRDDVRLLPQTFDGALLTSSEIEGLTLTAGNCGSRALASRPAATTCTSWAATRPTPATSSISPVRPTPSPLGSAPAITTASSRTSTGSTISACCTPCRWAKGCRCAATCATSTAAKTARRSPGRWTIATSTPCSPCAPAPTPSASVSRR